MFPPDRFDTEPIIGWRTWFADWDGLLYSPSMENLWPLGERFEAECYALVHHHGSCPDSKCKCGIYAYKEPLAAGYMYTMVEDNFALLCPGGSYPVIGQVSLWGRIIEHDMGYRAQYAYPTMLRTPLKAVARSVQARYGVETEATG